MADTNIEWTDRVWNPIRGCSRVSEGCRNCYAERQAIRQAGEGGAYEGLVKSIDVVRDGRKFHEPRWTGKIALDYEKLKEPLRWKKPARIFVNSMSDLFHPEVPDKFIDLVFAVMALSPQHTFQILTKRPDRMRQYLTAGLRVGSVWMATGFNEFQGMGSPCPQWPLPNVWLGVSVEDQQAANERIPLLIDTPAAIHWVSAEPLLGAVDFRSIQYGKTDLTFNALQGSYDGKADRVDAIDWVVVGGESGPNARPCNIEWIRAIAQECQRISVPVFVKQLGAKPFLHRQQSVEKKIPGGTFSCSSLEFESTVDISDRKGGEPSDWPADLRVREYPHSHQEATGGA